MAEKESPQPEPEPNYWDSKGQMHCKVCGMIKPQHDGAVKLHEGYHKRNKETP